MYLVKGENISISIHDKIISCWRSSTLQLTADTIGKSTIGSGNWKEFEGSVLSWTVSGEGQIWQDAAFTIHDVYDLMVSLVPVFVTWSVVAVDDVGSVVSTIEYYGYAIITSIQETGNVNDSGSFNVTMQGTGELSKTTDHLIDTDNGALIDTDGYYLKDI